MQINKNQFEPVSIQSVISAEDKKDKAQLIDEKRRDETSREKKKLFQVKFQNYTQIYIKIYLNIRNIIIMNFKTKIEIFIFWLSNKAVSWTRSKLTSNIGLFSFNVTLIWAYLRTSCSGTSYRWLKL